MNYPQSSSSSSSGEEQIKIKMLSLYNNYLEVANDQYFKDHVYVAIYYMVGYEFKKFPGDLLEIVKRFIIPEQSKSLEILSKWRESTNDNNWTNFIIHLRTNYYLDIDFMLTLKQNEEKNRVKVSSPKSKTLELDSSLLSNTQVFDDMFHLKTELSHAFVGSNILSNAIQSAKSLDPLLYNHCIPILQSSGYGKTKACLDILQRHRAVYLICHDKQLGIHMPSNITMAFQNLKTLKAHARASFFSKMMHSLVEIARGYQTALDLYQAQYESNEFYIKLNQKWADINSLPSPQKVQFSLDQEQNPEKLLNLDNDLIIIFDEISSLRTPHEDEDSPYTPIRTIARFINQSDLYAIFLSTNTKLKSVAPGHNLSNPVNEKIDLPIVYQIFFQNQFKEHLFFRGRPLWNAYFQTQAKSFTKLLEYCYFKLLRKESTSLQDRAQVIFPVRFGLKPASLLAEKLVEHHLATLIDFQDDSQTTMIIKYLSEPILSEISARITCTDLQTFGPLISKEACIEYLKDTIKPSESTFYVGHNKGDVGEFIAAVGLGYTLDILKEMAIKLKYTTFIDDNLDATMSREIDVPTFLAALCGLSVDKFQNYHDWVINFTHFVQEKVNKNSIILAYEQNAAFLLGGTNKGYDLLIPMKRKIVSESQFTEDRPFVKNLEFVYEDLFVQKQTTSSTTIQPSKGVVMNIGKTRKRKLQQDSSAYTSKLSKGSKSSLKEGGKELSNPSKMILNPDKANFKNVKRAQEEDDVYEEEEEDDDEDEDEDEVEDEDEKVEKTEKDEEEEFGVLAIQVKNYKEDIQGTERDKIINKCHPGLFQKYVESKNVISILLCVGNQNIQVPPVVENKDYPVHDTRSGPEQHKWLCISTHLQHFNYLSTNIKTGLNDIASTFSVNKPTFLQKVGRSGDFAYTSNKN